MNVSMFNFIRKNRRIRDVDSREENDGPDDLIRHHVVYGLMTAHSDHHSQYAYSRGREISVCEFSLVTVVVICKRQFS